MTYTSPDNIYERTDGLPPWMQALNPVNMGELLIETFVTTIAAPLDRENVGEDNIYRHFATQQFIARKGGYYVWRIRDGRSLFKNINEDNSYDSFVSSVHFFVHPVSLNKDFYISEKTAMPKLGGLSFCYSQTATLLDSLLRVRLYRHGVIDRFESVHALKRPSASWYGTYGVWDNTRAHTRGVVESAVSEIAGSDHGRPILLLKSDFDYSVRIVVECLEDNTFFIT